MEVTYIPGANPPVQVHGADRKEATVADLALFNIGNEELKQGGYNLSGRQWPIGGNFTLDKLFVERVGVSGSLISNEVVPVRTVVLTQRNSAYPKRVLREWLDYSEVPGLSRTLFGREMSFDDFVEALSVQQIANILRTRTKYEPPEFDMRASHSVTNTAERTTNNTYGAGIENKTKFTVGGEAASFKVENETTLRFDYERGEGSRDEQTETFGTDEGIGNIRIYPGDVRAVNYSGKKGVLRLSVVCNTRIDGQIGLNWDHDVTVGGRRGRQFYFKLSDLGIWRDGVTYEEEHRIERYSENNMTLGRPEA